MKGWIDPEIVGREWWKSREEPQGVRGQSPSWGLGRCPPKTECKSPFCLQFPTLLFWICEKFSRSAILADVKGRCIPVIFWIRHWRMRHTAVRRRDPAANVIVYIILNCCIVIVVLNAWMYCQFNHCVDCRASAPISSKQLHKQPVWLLQLTARWSTNANIGSITYSAASGKVMPMKAGDRHSVYISMPVPRM